MRIMLLLVSAIAASAQEWTEAQVTRAMAPFDHVLLLDEGGSVQRWSQHLKATDAFQPCSTFKLPHALIALETGVISLERDRRRCVPSECHSDHGELDLASAIRESCLSYFRQTARAIGPTRMAAGLAKLGYAATGALEPFDGFWLLGGMRITAEQQLRWIRRFYTEALPVKAEHLQRCAPRACGPRVPSGCCTARRAAPGKASAGSWARSPVKAGPPGWWSC